MLICAAKGGALGLLLARWGVKLIVAISPNSIPRSREINLDARVLVFTVGVSVLTGIIFGLVPALKSAAIDTARGLASALPRARLRSVLVVAQVAFSVVLVVLAGLFGHSLAELRSIDLGFRNENVIAFTLDYPQGWKAAQMRAARNPYQSMASSASVAPAAQCGAIAAWPRAHWSRIQASPRWNRPMSWWPTLS